MRKVGDIMKELGFREDGSDSVKKAFIRNLIKSCGKQELIAQEIVQTVIEKPRVVQCDRPENLHQRGLNKSNESQKGHQLSFDFAECDAPVALPKSKMG